MNPATELEIKTYELAKEHKFNEAFKMISLHNSTKNKPPGINMNWTDLSEKGLGINEIEIYESVYSRPTHLSTNLITFEDDIRAMSILAYMNGDVAYYVPRLFKKLKDITGATIKITPKLRQEIYRVEHDIFFYISHSVKIDSFAKLGFKKYGIMCDNIDEACDFCKALNEKLFYVQDAIIGVNCPPFHSLCSCTILPSARK